MNKEFSYSSSVFLNLRRGSGSSGSLESESILKSFNFADVFLRVLDFAGGVLGFAGFTLDFSFSEKIRVSDLLELKR